MDIPDDLIRQAKARAVLEGMSLRELVTYGLKLALQAPPPSARSTRAAFPLIRSRPESPPVTEAETSTALAELDEDEALRYAKVVRH